MKIKIKIYSLLMFVIAASIASAQTIFDTIALAEVNIFEKIEIAPIGSKTDKIDSIFIAENNTSSLSDIIMLHSPISIKSYGKGGLSTASFRGSSASHTQVLWNGININSPMLGQTDFSLIPIFFVDDIHINYGSSSLQETSGGIGGSINLINKPNWKNRLWIQAVSSIASFNTYNNLIKLNVGNNKIQSRTKLFISNSENNFEYDNITRDSIFLRKYASYQSQGALQEIYFRPNISNSFSAKIWIQKAHKDLPANILVYENERNAYQEDNSVRSVFEWTNYGERFKTKAYSGIIYDKLLYVNKELNLNTLNTSKVFKQQLQTSYDLSRNHKVSLTLNHQHFIIDSDNYLKTQKANIINSSIIFNGNLISRLSYSFTIRYENFDFNKSSGLMPLVGLQYFIKKDQTFKVFANFSKNNRFPTMNDLYWFPNGNPDLKPEVSLCSELGITNNFLSKDYLSIEGMLTVYNSDVNNWIVWQPVSGSGFDWSPTNFKKVISKGLESKLKIESVLNDYKIKYSLLYNFTNTVNREIYDDLETDLIGKQLIYIPSSTISSNIDIRYKSVTFTGIYNYTGKRYISSDNLQYLPEYAKFDLAISKYFLLNKFTFVVEGKLRNITDVKYQSIAYYPMPGRNYELKAIFNFKK